MTDTGQCVWQPHVSTGNGRLFCTPNCQDKDCWKWRVQGWSKSEIYITLLLRLQQDWEKKSIFPAGDTGNKNRNMMIHG